MWITLQKVFGYLTRVAVDAQITTYASVAPAGKRGRRGWRRKGDNIDRTFGLQIPQRKSATNSPATSAVPVHSKEFVQSDNRTRRVLQTKIQRSMNLL